MLLRELNYSQGTQWVQTRCSEKTTSSEVSTALQALAHAAARADANMTDESQAIATAEINRMSPVQQAEMIREGKNATIVSEAAARQRRCAPTTRRACESWPVGQMRLYVAAGGSRMKIEEPNATVAHKKQLFLML